MPKLYYRANKFNLDGEPLPSRFNVGYDQNHGFYRDLDFRKNDHELRQDFCYFVLRAYKVQVIKKLYFWLSFWSFTPTPFIVCFSFNQTRSNFFTSTLTDLVSRLPPTLLRTLVRTSSIASEAGEKHISTFGTQNIYLKTISKSRRKKKLKRILKKKLRKKESPFSWSCNSFYFARKFLSWGPKLFFCEFKVHDHVLDEKWIYFLRAYPFIIIML